MGLRIASREKTYRQAVAFARRLGGGWGDTCLYAPTPSLRERGIASESSSYPAHTVLNFPSLSPTMSEGTLVQWNVKVGQEVAAGDVLAEVETDKATLGWENQDEGWVAKLLVAEGASVVGVGRAVCVLCEEEADVGKFADYVAGDGGAGSAGSAGSAGLEIESGVGVAEGESKGSARTWGARMGPAARILMEAHGMDVGRVVGTGPRGLVTKGDVLEAVEAGSRPVAGAAGGATRVQPGGGRAAEGGAQHGRNIQGTQHTHALAEGGDSVAAPEFVDIPTTNMRKVIARRLLESKTTVPHMYASIDISLDNVLSMRKRLAANGTKISVNDCVLRAVALALQEVPAANAYWDDAAGEIRPSPAVDVCVAVATEGGLYTPIVKDANRKSLSEISADVRRLAGKAKQNALMPEEYVGGSFSVSNLGMFGVENFSAIINPPQGGILAVGGGRQVTRIGADGGLASVTEMTVTLSADGRVYDGQTAGDFLEAFKANMEDPTMRLSIV